MEKLFGKRRKISSTFFVVLIIVSTILIIATVYLVGGTKHAFDHLMYLPIIFTGICFGITPSVALAVVVGLILGPFMPADVKNNIPQDTFCWVLRALAYIFSGIVVGFLRSIFVKVIDENEKLYTHNKFTNIPNTKILSSVDFSSYGNKTSALSLIIEKYELIVYYFGEEVYANLLVDIYNALNDHILTHKTIVSNGSNFIGLLIDNDDPNISVREVVQILRDLRKRLKYPIYFEFSIGTEIIENINKQNVTEAVFKESTSKAISSIVRKNFLRDPTTASTFDYPLLADIEKALLNDEFYLVYQPLKYHKQSNVLFFEALIRWNHPTKGLIPPNEFIPLVENTLLINPLSLWVLRNTIIQIKKYKEQGIDIMCSINISPINLYSTTFVNSVQAVIDEFNFDTTLIKFEITEGIAFNISKRALNNLNRLNEMGIDLAIDDFGSGHASVSYLIQLPIKYVKLDRLLTANIMNDEREKILFLNTVKLLKNLNLEIVGEGIETKEHYDALKEVGLHYYQGYYFSHPLSGDGLHKWITKTPKKFLKL